ncbi:50S ribosomal protein L15 [Candidatus Poribacteria bacterium]|nr:50S ribosomal protein L15 [Candidatus Poribacteria bacterium]
MELHDLKPAKGAKKSRKRVGRGEGSGHGKTSGRGHKGQGARAGASIPAWFEGGQMPLYRRLPLRGFKPIRRRRYAVVNVGDLEAFENGSVVTPDELLAARIVRNLSLPVKILGSGALTKPLTVRAHKFSRSAEESIRSAGGTIEALQ